VVLDPFQGEENVGLDHLGASRVWGWIEKSFMSFRRLLSDSGGLSLVSVAKLYDCSHKLREV